MDTLQPYQPSLRDRLAWLVAGGAGKLGAGRYAQQDIASKVGGLLDFVPGVGDVVNADDAGRAFDNGDYLGAAINASMLFPGVGDVAGKVGKGLRERYSRALMDAAAGKDINRIKLTPDRIEKAKASLSDSIANWNYYRSPEGKFAPTQQMLNAQDFARQMVRQGEDVRFKIPEGERGSLYVRVGDRGTVRFSDHPQPTEGNQIVGGYSSTLGRRHQPATYSVSPSEMTIDDVMGLYGYNPNGAR